METRTSTLEKQVRLLYMSMCSCREIPTFAHVNRRTGRKRIHRNDQEVDNVTVVVFFFQRSSCDFITTLPEIWQRKVTWSSIIIYKYRYFHW